MKHILILLITFSSFSLMAESLADSSKIYQIQMAIAQLDAVEDHCEVPCGIYGDSLRIALIDEHIRTIEKATNQINELSMADKPNYNQLVRWINNKEKHAEEIQQIVSQYFLHQRVKIVDPSDKGATKKYQEMLTHLHHISVYAMKTKQGTDLENIAKLKAAVESFDDVYFHTHSH
jgi:nickel superoxide dismutase